MEREREEWEEFLQPRKSRFLISHGLKMTTPCLSSSPPSTPPPNPQAAAGRACRPHCSAWQSIYRLVQGTHSCTSWTRPHGLWGRVPPRRAATKHVRVPSCSSSPRPWHLATLSPPGSRANTKAPLHPQAFLYQELTSELTKVALNTPPCFPPPQPVFIQPDRSQESLVNEARKVTLPPELAESGAAVPYSSEGKACVIDEIREGVLVPRCISSTTVQLPEYIG